MTNDLPANLTGAWAGVYTLNGDAAPLLVSWESRESGGSGAWFPGVLDFPASLTFRQPVVARQTAAGRFRFTAPTVQPPLTFACQLIDGRLVGSAQAGAHDGTLELSRRAALDPAFATDIVGTYARTSDDIVCVGLGGDGDNKFPCYAQGDSLVRLYPLSMTTLLSDRAELLTVVRDGGGSVTGIRWQAHGGEALLAPRVQLYAEEAVSFHNGDVTLAGTLLLPPGGGPFPAVVLMHGTFPGERDFYRVYAADQFARHGIAALIYDKRGFGASSRGVQSTIADRATDALCAVQLLRTRSDIHPGQVGLWGFSNSTWSLPWAAARSDAVAFLIATGAAGVSMADAEVHRRVWELREWNLPERVLAAVGRLWQMAFTIAVGGNWQDGWDAEWDELVDQLRQNEALVAIPLADYARANPMLSPIPPLIPAQALRAQLAEASSERGEAEELRDMGHDPVADYEHVTCPVLFVIGERDDNLPAHACASRVAAALARAGNPDYQTIVLPDVAHMLNLAYPQLRGMSTGEAASHLHQFRFSPGCRELVTTWLLQRTRRLA